ncbi:penicillin acylase family protein, partial [Thermodesulfobacteriota bacterium]
MRLRHREPRPGVEPQRGALLPGPRREARSPRHGVPIPGLPGRGPPLPGGGKTGQRRSLRARARARQRIRDLTALGGPASNNWAIAGSRTASGRPIVANDTHLHLSMPSFWMIMHLKSPTYNAAGVKLLSPSYMVQR